MTRPNELTQRCANVPSEDVGQAALGIIGSVEHLKPEVQIMALAVSFLFLSQHLKTEPADIYTYVSNLINRRWNNVPEIRAVKDYITYEV